jgi:AcrR family transcriptional regulator
LSTLAKTRKSERTREAILASALGLFRRRGFDRTTMRDVAEAAGVALGAAYYYFPSKEALVLAYYAKTQDEHSRRARAATAAASDLRGRVGAVVHTKLDVLARDRKLLGAIFKSVGDPEDPLSVFGEASKDVRDESMRLFDEALEGAQLDEPTRVLAARAMWALHMGVLLYFLHDPSPRQTQTRELADGALDLAVQVVAAAPMMGEMLAPAFQILARAGLI